jgi:hypothetical protein
MNFKSENNLNKHNEIKESAELSPGTINNNINVKMSSNFSNVLSSHFPLWKDEEEYQPEYPNDYEEVKNMFT